MSLKKSDKIPINQYIIKLAETDKLEIIGKTLLFINNQLKKQLIIKDNDKKTRENILKFLTVLSRYEQIRDYFEDELKFDIKDI